MKLLSPIILCVFACAGTAQPLTETIQFTNGDATLEGELSLPAVSKAPLVVFVHGSGMATRHDYDDITFKLNAAGYATFQYDKRGVGNSGGTFREVGTYNSIERIELLAGDAAAAVRLLSEHQRINREKIIVMGGSQAGWIIPVVASKVSVSATVCISGPTVSVGEEIYYSDLAENNEHTQDESDRLFTNFNGVRGFDNIRYVSQMKKPSLWIFGGKDVSIPVNRCIARLDSTTKAAKLPVEMKIFPDGDHGLFNAKTHTREDFVAVILNWLAL